MPGQLLAGVRVAGVEDGTQLRAGHLTRQAQMLGARAQPPAGLLAAGEVVALGPVLLRDGGEVVAGPTGAHPPDVQQRPAELLPWPSASLCLRFMTGRMRPQRQHVQVRRRPRRPA